MKEDILEQLVDDYLQSKGYFTRHNIKFRPDSTHKDFDLKQDSNHSDIDAEMLSEVSEGMGTTVMAEAMAHLHAYRGRLKDRQAEAGRLRD